MASHLQTKKEDFKEEYEEEDTFDDLPSTDVSLY